MKRRSLLQALAAFPFSPSALGLRVSIPLRLHSSKETPALIGIGTYCMNVVDAGCNQMPQGIRGMGIEVIARRRFHGDLFPVHRIDEDALPEKEHPMPYEVFDPGLWQALLAFLPEDETWLIVGSLEERACFTLLPLLVRYGVLIGKRVHVFGLGPYFDKDCAALSSFSSQRALAVQQTVADAANSTVIMQGDDMAQRFGWNTATDSWNGSAYYETLGIFEDACHAWMLHQCEAFKSR